MKDTALSVIEDDIAELNRALKAAVAVGDIDAAKARLLEVESLEAERNRIMAMLAPKPSRYSTAIPVRDRVIQVLGLTKVVTSARLLSELSYATFQESLATSALASLRRDEMRSWVAAQTPESRTTLRDVYVVPALSHDRFTPVRGSLALSNWPLRRRLLTPLSPRVDLLMATIAVAERCAAEGEASGLNKVLRSLRPSSRPWDEMDAASVMASAREELALIKETDDRERRDAEVRAKAMNPQAQLFGSPLRVAKTSRGHQPVRRSGTS